MQLKKTVLKTAGFGTIVVPMSFEHNVKVALIFSLIWTLENETWFNTNSLHEKCHSLKKTQHEIVQTAWAHVKVRNFSVLNF